MNTIGPASSVLGKTLKRDNGFTFDFGIHVVGRLRLDIGLGERAADSPLRLKLTFGETPAEVSEAFDPYGGNLSRAWLQDEIVSIDVMPCVVTFPRRYAFRYLKIEMFNASPGYEVKVNNIVCEAVSSADSKAILPAIDSIPARWREMDRVSLRTLANCMQTVFEDGPKRDRRLWVGDLRLQALANYESFRNYDLVKRCLYLFAGLARDNGKIPVDLYENPSPRRGNEYILDYGAMFPVILADYVDASNDNATGIDLWPAALRQLDFVLETVSPEGLFIAPDKVWIFIDWCTPLHRQASMHAVIVYALRRTIALAEKLGKQEDVTSFTGLISRMTDTALTNFRDGENPQWISGPEKQVSWASWAWMTLSGIASREDAVRSYRALGACPDAVMPNGPYLYHHVVDALFCCGLKDEAMHIMNEYWGDMMAKGATTFWEVFNPADDFLSPYNSYLINSYCHAWSCTPSYFIRKYGLE